MPQSIQNRLMPYDLPRLIGGQLNDNMINAYIRNYSLLLYILVCIFLNLHLGIYFIW